MTFNDLMELERVTPHMRDIGPDVFRKDGWCSDTSVFLSALRNLAPELLALWEAVAADTRDDDGNPCDCPRPVCRALRELNRKALPLIN